jgi:hypothetical protein
MCIIKPVNLNHDDKSWKGILVGYEPNGYKVWNSESAKFVTVRDVIVDETNFLTSRPVILPEDVENSNDKPDSENISKSASSKSRYSDNLKSDAFKSDDIGPPIKNQMHLNLMTLALQFKIAD